MTSMVMMRPSSVRRRKMIDYCVKIFAYLAASLGMGVLAWILWVLSSWGLSAISWDFLVLETAPTGFAGGVGNAIVGTALLTSLAAIMGIPTGILAGVFLAEFGKDNYRFSEAVRLLNNMLMGAPSIVIGVFVYAILVSPNSIFSLGTYSAMAGGAALAIIMLPVVTRTTEDILNMVPDSLRESGLALGAPRWRVTLDILFRKAKTGLLTGVILAVARVSGETAPLLFTALNNNYAIDTNQRAMEETLMAAFFKGSSWFGSFGETVGNFPWIDLHIPWLEVQFPTLEGIYSILFEQPIANLTVTIYEYAGSPYPDLKERAWGASFVILVTVLFLNILARYVIKEKKA